MKKVLPKITKQMVDEHLNAALKEIGKIEPWFDEQIKEWVFEHPLYPESYSGTSKKEVIKNYPLYLRQFIEQRLKGNLAPAVEKKTGGRGGRREGAGRPKGTIKRPTCTIRLPLDIASWIKSNPKHLSLLHRLANEK